MPFTSYETGSFPDLELTNEAKPASQQASSLSSLKLQAHATLVLGIIIKWTGGLGAHLNSHVWLVVSLRYTGLHSQVSSSSLFNAYQEF